jgi:N-acetylneuraminic acid mutarotase
MKKVYIFFVILICSIYFSPPLDSQPPNTWIQKANFSGVGRASSVAFSMGGKGYIGIGEDMYGNEYNDFWEYDTITNSWTQKANVGGGVRSRAIGFSIGSKGYIGIGAGGTGNFSWKKRFMGVRSND